MVSEWLRSERPARGFSIIELMMAMSITLGIGLIVFQLFLQNERVFRDQNLVLEMQQSARAVASMLVDEIRMAGQGVPVFAASQNTGPVEGAQTFLNGTNSTTLVFRSGLDNGSATIQNAPPLAFTVSVQSTLTVDDVTPISGIIGANTDRFVYIWGPTANSWTWVRAQVDSINAGTNQITLTPRQIAAAGGSFPQLPELWVEQAVAYRLSGGNVERGTAGDFTTQTAPVLSYSTVGSGFTSLTFTYYDGSGNVVAGTDLASRSTIRRVDFTIGAETAQPLASTGSPKTFAVSMSVSPRNVAIY